MELGLNYGLKQEQNNESLNRLCKKMKQKLHNKFEPMEIFFGYLILEELTMFTMFLTIKILITQKTKSSRF